MPTAKKTAKKSSTKKKTTRKKKKATNAGRPQSEIATGNPHAMRVAANVRRLRKKKKLSVAVASKRAGISQETWYRIERAAVEYRTPWGTLQKIAKVLGVKDSYSLQQEPPSEDK